VKYTYLENKELEVAIEEFVTRLKDTKNFLTQEEIEVSEAFGRIASQAVFAKISAPHYYACAMDGIAVSAKDTFGATDTTPILLKKGRDYEAVDTGDPLPRDKDAVIMVEDVVVVDKDTVKIHSSASPWQHVRQIGEDICQDEMIIPSNTKIEPAAIGAMLAGGVGKVRVYKKPIIGLIPTGDEIVSPRPDPKAGEIIEFNTSIFSSMAEKWGVDSKTYPIVKDDLNLIKKSVLTACKECDLVILNAGSSAGREDFAFRAISETGDVLTHGIAIRPGKPTILGVVGKKAVVGVPGYPVSGIIVMETVVKKVLEEMVKSTLPKGEKLEAILSRRLMSSLKYKEFVRMKLGKVNNRFIATPLNRGAGVVTSFVKADGLLEIPLNKEGVEAGQKVQIELLNSKEEIENTLLINGSHDPLIDEAYDLVRKRDYKRFISSSHVGSMGGIMAVKRGETHLAGIHLLDEATGEYNRTYVNKYLKNQDVCLIKGVRRSQGLMTAKGNPMNIKDILDLKDSKIRYVNRQKGSGTRILLDYQLRLSGIDQKSIYGYDREELTHLSVAVQIAAGSADAGLGIYSAAKVYGLDFVPVCWESYDFITTKEFIEDEKVAGFIDVLKSKEFKDALEKLGGYEISGIGEVECI